MKKIISCFILSLSINISAHAELACLIAMNAKTGEVVAQQGESCGERLPPCSTFKVPLSLMGYETAILKDETHPEWPFTPRADGRSVEAAQQIPLTPKTWMVHSSVWFSQVLTPKIGAHRFSAFVKQFDYGNQDISGEPGKQNGLTNAWLSSSLKISPVEQLGFLRKLVNRELPVSEHAIDMTKSIIFLKTLENNWQFYGKTGTGFARHSDGTPDLNNQIAWLVGWIEKSDQAPTLFAFAVKHEKEVPAREERYEKVEHFLKEAGLLG